MSLSAVHGEVERVAHPRQLARAGHLAAADQVVVARDGHGELEGDRPRIGPPPLLAVGRLLDDLGRVDAAAARGGLVLDRLHPARDLAGLGLLLEVDQRPRIDLHIDHDGPAEALVGAEGHGAAVEAGCEVGIGGREADLLGRVASLPDSGGAPEPGRVGVGGPAAPGRRRGEETDGGLGAGIAATHHCEAEWERREARRALREERAGVAPTLEGAEVGGAGGIVIAHAWQALAGVDARGAGGEAEVAGVLVPDDRAADHAMCLPRRRQGRDAVDAVARQQVVVEVPSPLVAVADTPAAGAGAEEQVVAGPHRGRA